MSEAPSGSSPSRVTVIAAVARNGVIGRDNGLPWRLPDDLKRFKALTLGHPVIMGRKTWESLGRPLPGRRNMVASRNPAFTAPGAEVFPSLEAALAACVGDAPPAYVIGGAELYRQALSRADTLELTEIDAEFAGDASFPDVDRSVWRETARQSMASDQGFAYAFATYRREPGVQADQTAAQATQSTK